MAVVLTPDEQAEVANAQQSPRPEYFSAQEGKKRQISGDFEAFLILQDPSVTEETLGWLGSAGSIAQTRLDRNAVTFEALIADREDREARQSELADLTQSFNDWRLAFQAGKFSDVGEVGLIIADMQATAEEIFVHEERAKHLEQMQQLTAERLRQSVSNAQLQQLLSWPTPLLAY